MTSSRTAARTAKKPADPPTTELLAATSSECYQPSMGMARKSILSGIGALLLAFWAVWRWFIVAGGPWVAGHSCSTLMACRDGLCIVHERASASGPLVPVEGYCTKRCEADADCPSDMKCEALPDGISSKAGDHLPVVTLPKRLCIRTRLRDGGR